MLYAINVFTIVKKLKIGIKIKTMIGLTLLATVVVYNIIIFFKEEDEKKFSKVAKLDEEDPHLFI